MTLLDLFSRRDVADVDLPQQASDADLLAWSEEIRGLADPDPAVDDEVIDLRPPAHLARRPLRAAPAPPEPLEPEVRVVRPAPRRARPLVAPPAAWVEG